MSEPVDFAQVEVHNFYEDWGYNLSEIEMSPFDSFERQLDGSMTEDVGAGVTDTVGDTQCTNMRYF